MVNHGELFVAPPEGRRQRGAAYPAHRSQGALYNRWDTSICALLEVLVLWLQEPAKTVLATQFKVRFENSTAFRLGRGHRALLGVLIHCWRRGPDTYASGLGLSLCLSGLGIRRPQVLQLSGCDRSLASPARAVLMGISGRGLPNPQWDTHASGWWNSHVCIPLKVGRSVATATRS